MRFLLLSTFCLIFSAIKSQPLSDSLELKIKRLIKSQSDTVISFYAPHYFFAIPDSVKGLGEIRESEIGYLISKSGNKINATKQINYFKAIIGDNFASSNSITFAGDTIFSFLSRNWEGVQLATFPYIYKITINDSDHFDILMASHPPIVNIGIHTMARSFYFQINTDYMEYQVYNLPPNLNYYYNFHSGLCLLFLKLSGLIKALDKDFVFRK